MMLHNYVMGPTSIKAVISKCIPFLAVARASFCYWRFQLEHTAASVINQEPSLLLRLNKRMSVIEDQANETSWLNSDFVETILRRHRNDAELCVTHIDIQNAVGKGDNYASIIMRVATEFNSKNKNKEETDKCSLIVKSLPNGDFFQKWIKEVSAFEREQRIYQVTLPQIYKLMENTEMDQEHLASNFYVTDRPNTIILEDLRPLGYKMADRKQGLDLHHSTLALRTLAKLHATSMVLHAKCPESIEYYTDNFYIEECREMLTVFFEHSMRPIATEVRSWEGFERFGDKVELVISTAVDRMIDLAKNKEGALKVLNHGDYWVNNMLFRYENDKAVDLKMVDFQIIRFASPALDILYFMHMSLSQEVLENHQDLLIKEYHKSLTETLGHLGYDRKITLEDINKELEDKAYLSVVISCLHCIVVADPEDALDFSGLKEADVGKGIGVEGMDRACAGKTFRNTFQKRLTKFEEQKLI